jgi:1,4-alpha-glucan branching enzyme
LFYTFAAKLKYFIMAIKKQYLKSKPVCKVTFSIEAKDAKKVTVAGDWNKWSVKATPLKKLKNGTFKGTVDLPSDKSYEFKYVVDGNYVNDNQADEYVWNDFAASENGVIKL